MQLPIKAHYATLAMLCLAQRYASGELMPARLIAKQQRIPLQFLGQILQQLRAAGLILSTRGSNGGFQLSRDPAEINIAEIVDAVYSCGGNLAGADHANPMAKVVLDLWCEVSGAQQALLERLHLGDLLSRVDQHDSLNMYYI
ncbi:MAG: Rrf2 family transcriptional regulator [Planctomycetales bacterium]|nr:Rrf2 family transcriptional regulator [Planctomycetales bacterium]